MIVAFSTSSPQSSVALIETDGRLIAASQKMAPMQASGACMELLQVLLADAGRSLREATLFAADLGPGSFTGVKVAVTLAKTLAFVQSVQVIGADSFDLISAEKVVFLPSKKGEFFIREPGKEPYRTTTLPAEGAVGFGATDRDTTYPLASRFSDLKESWLPMPAEALVPNYLIEPSISLPKKPLSGVGPSHV